MNIIRKVKLDSNLDWVVLSDRVSVIQQILKRPGKKGRREKYRVLYVGVDNYQEAQRIISKFFSDIPRMLIEVRCAKRSIDWSTEIKVQGDFDVDQLNELCQKVDLVLDGSFSYSIFNW